MLVADTEPDSNQDRKVVLNSGKNRQPTFGRGAWAKTLKQHQTVMAMVSAGCATCQIKVRARNPPQCLASRSVHHHARCSWEEAALAPISNERDVREPIKGTTCYGVSSFDGSLLPSLLPSLAASF